jgi:hypothetical protein
MEVLRSFVIIPIEMPCPGNAIGEAELIGEPVQQVKVVRAFLPPVRDLKLPADKDKPHGLVTARDGSKRLQKRFDPLSRINR